MELVDPMLLSVDDGDHNIFAIIQNARGCLVRGGLDPAGVPFGSVVEPWLENAGQQVRIVPVCLQLGLSLMVNNWKVFHCVPLTGKVDRNRLLGVPPTKT